MNRLLKLARALVNPIGLAGLLRTRTVAGVEHLSLLRGLRPNTVIDVGANKGQFSLAARMAGVRRIIAFEPLAVERTTLRRNLPSDAYIIAVALGQESRRASFHVASRRDSSSLLPPGDGERRAFGVTGSSTIEIDVKRLDMVVSPTDLSAPVLLKIDVQGAELDVLEGAIGLLHAVDFVYAEAAFVPLYDGQVLAGELVAWMLSRGYALRGAHNVSHSKAFGQTQADLLFVRQNSAFHDRGPQP